MREIPDIPESVDELEGVGEGVALLVPDDVCICCETRKEKERFEMSGTTICTCICTCTERGNVCVHVRTCIHVCPCNGKVVYMCIAKAFQKDH